MIDFQQLEEGEVVVLDVEWDDGAGVETAEMEFVAHDAEAAEIVVRDADSRERYRVSETCDELSAHLWKECECYNCGQLHWKPSGTVIGAEAPAVAEDGQQTLADI